MMISCFVGANFLSRNKMALSVRINFVIHAQMCIRACSVCVIIMRNTRLFLTKCSKFVSCMLHKIYASQK